MNVELSAQELVNKMSWRTDAIKTTQPSGAIYKRRVEGHLKVTNLDPP